MTHFLIIVIYLSFISLGLPDSLLGAAWPSMQPEFGVPVSWAGAALFGFSLSHSYPELFLWAVPYGLGAGSVDAALNKYTRPAPVSKTRGPVISAYTVKVTVPPPAHNPLFLRRKRSGSLPSLWPYSLRSGN